MLAEHEGGTIKSSSISSVEAAKSLSKDNSISMLLAGSGPSLQQAASHAASCHPLISQVTPLSLIPDFYCNRATYVIFLLPP